MGGMLAKASLHGIVPDVRDGIVIVVEIPDEAVLIIGIPKGAGLSCDLVDPCGRDAFPTLDDRTQRMMHMVGHHTPFDQFVARRVP